jgi:hypothetical protein
MDAGDGANRRRGEEPASPDREASSVFHDVFSAEKLADATAPATFLQATSAWPFV